MHPVSPACGTEEGWDPGLLTSAGTPRHLWVSGTHTGKESSQCDFRVTNGDVETGKEVPPGGGSELQGPRGPLRVSLTVPAANTDGHF